MCHSSVFQSIALQKEALKPTNNSYLIEQSEFEAVHDKNMSEEKMNIATVTELDQPAVNGSTTNTEKKTLKEIVTEGLEEKGKGGDTWLW